MTVWKLNPASSVAAAKGGMDDDLLDLMAQLDSLPQDAKRSAPKGKPAAAKAVEPPPFVQQWFPRALVMHATSQECLCCDREYKSITGMFLEDQHRNGAVKQIRVEANVVPPEYFGLPTRTHWASESIAHCIECFQTEFKIQPAATPEELIRELSKDDRDSLKESA